MQVFGIYGGFPGDSVVKNVPTSAGDTGDVGLIPRLGRSSGHGIAKSQTRLSNFTFTFHCHALEKEMATHSSVLAWRIQGMGEPDELPSMGCPESDTTEAT